MNEPHDDETHLSTRDARAGSRNKLNRNVLAISLPLILLFFALIVAVGFIYSSQTGADEVNDDKVISGSDES